MRGFILTLFGLVFVSSVEAKSQDAPLKQRARDRIMVMVISGADVSLSKDDVRQKTREILETHLHADVVSNEETFVHGGASFQKMLEDCRGVAACYARLVGSVSARYLLVVSARAAGEIVVLGSRMIDLDAQKVSGQAIGRVPSTKNLMLEIKTQLRKTIPEPMWDPYGSITVNVEQSGAQVHLNDALMGISPISRIDKILPGNYTVSVSSDGYAMDKRTISVRRNEDSKVQFNLQPKSGLLSQWWFWLGVGVVAVSGVSAGVLLSNQGPPVFCSSPEPSACP